MTLIASQLTRVDHVSAHVRPTAVAGWSNDLVGPLPGDDALAAEIGLSPDASWRGALRDSGLRASQGETLVVTLLGPDGVGRRLVLVGLPGDGDDVLRRVAPVDLGVLAQYAARAVPRARHWVTSLPALGTDPADSAESVTEGLLIGGYAYDCAEETEVTIVGLEGDRWRAAATHGQDAARLVNQTRRLVERPGGELDPVTFGEVCATMLESAGAGCEIWEGSRLADEGFGATAAVGRASASGARVVVARREGSSRRHLGLTGKGVTFDGGGLNLKTDAHEINWMKSDMAGAASVAGAVAAALRAGADPSLTVVLPIAENVIGPSALRPGDVVRHPDASTTEVLNTDCEGRLLLADSLAWMAVGGQDTGREGRRPDALIDVGTLGDACGYGPRLWSVAGHGLVEELLRAGEVTGDRGWGAPLLDDYRTIVADSRVADYANWAPGSGVGGSVYAGVYLSQFAHGLPWAHIDNGSTAYLERACGPWPAGATGSPLRALARLIRDGDATTA